MMVSTLRAAATSALVCGRRAHIRQSLCLPHICTSVRPWYFSSLRQEEDDDATDEGRPRSLSRPSSDVYWNKKLCEFREFVKKHGHSHVPYYFLENTSLARWAQMQREQYSLWQKGQASRLTEERIARLNELGFVWTRRDYRWDERFDELIEYFYEHGHVNVPGQYPGGLGKWVSYQRRQYYLRQDGMEHHMTDDKLIRLSSLGFTWHIFEASWEESFQLLVAFQKEHGHTNVPKDSSDKFSNWVASQRKNYKLFQDGKPCKISQERIDCLNQINFIWEPHEEAWLERYNELCQYQAELGHCLVPSKWEGNKALAIWVDVQRQEYKKRKVGKKSSMSDKRIELLEDIGFEWNALDAHFRNRVEELAEFIRANGFGRHPPYKTNQSLNRWLWGQEQQYERMKKGETVALTRERIKTLQKFGFLLEGAEED